MGTFYLSTFRSPYFFTFTRVKTLSQYFYFYQSIFKHKCLYFFLSKGCVYFCRNDSNTAFPLCLFLLLCCSGGKDSCYNMMQCVAAGHRIVALANLRPANTGEEDALLGFVWSTGGSWAIWANHLHFCDPRNCKSTAALHVNPTVNPTGIVAVCCRWEIQHSRVKTRHMSDI